MQTALFSSLCMSFFNTAINIPWTYYWDFIETVRFWLTNLDFFWPGLCTAQRRSPSSVTTVSWAVDRLSSSEEGSTISIELHRESSGIIEDCTNTQHRFDPWQRLKIIYIPIKDAKGCSNRMLVDLQPLSFIQIHNGCVCLCVDGDLWELSCRVRKSWG